eukprot:TRINITY_DN2619_c0_g1_i1.p1 TRINITY_DN2619_c0_g1~~TRINITY_DN2619_c0_g1_i1.p1  ORF type:complete len:183 (-),score=27.84 TRINITY_DN2619_c0_g1_i1:23-535(-)
MWAVVWIVLLAYRLFVVGLLELPIMLGCSLKTKNCNSFSNVVCQQACQVRQDLGIDVAKDFFPLDPIFAKEDERIRVAMMVIVGVVTPLIFLVTVGKIFRASWTHRVAWATFLVMISSFVPYFAELYLLQPKTFPTFLAYNAADLAIIFSAFVDSFGGARPSVSKAKKSQ